MNTLTLANLAKLDLETTMLCTRCAALLFGRVAYCPYCGADGAPSWDGSARVASPEPESTRKTIDRVSEGGAKRGLEGGVDRGLEGATRMLPELLAVALFESERVPGPPEPVPVPALEATNSIVTEASASASTSTPRPNGWTPGKTAALAVGIAAMALGAIYVYNTGAPGRPGQAKEPVEAVGDLKPLVPTAARASAVELKPLAPVAARAAAAEPAASAATVPIAVPITVPTAAPISVQSNVAAAMPSAMPSQPAASPPQSSAPGTTAEAPAADAKGGDCSDALAALGLCARKPGSGSQRDPPGLGATR